MDYERYFQETGRQKIKFNLSLDKRDLADMHDAARQRGITIAALVRGLWYAFLDHETLQQGATTNG